MPIQRKNDNTLDNFRFYEDKKSILEAQDTKRDYRDLVDENSDTRNRTKNSLSGYTIQDELLESELSSFLREIWFSKQQFPAGTPISHIKYHYLQS